MAASAWASKARIAEKVELGLAGRLAGLRPQDSEVWVLVFGFLGYFLWQRMQNVVAGGFVDDLVLGGVAAMYAEACSRHPPQSLLHPNVRSSLLP